jgi:hypothetical protein
MYNRIFWMMIFATSMRLLGGCADMEQPDPAEEPAAVSSDLDATETSGVVEAAAQAAPPADEITAAEDGAANNAALATPMASGGTAPACIHRTLSPLALVGWTVLVSNHCGKTMQVKVVVDLGPDSPCYRMGNGSWVIYTITLGHYGKTVVCG